MAHAAAPGLVLREGDEVRLRVMVRSSGLRTRPVPHWTKRCWPRLVKPSAKERKMACHIPHRRVTFT